jgi:hypothetical protein
VTTSTYNWNHNVQAERPPLIGGSYSYSVRFTLAVLPRFLFVFFYVWSLLYVCRFASMTEDPVVT